MTKRDMQRVIKRLEFIYEQLDGAKKNPLLSSNDEFANLQIQISEQIVSVRAKIQQRQRLERTGGNLAEVIKQKHQTNAAIADVETTLGKLRFLLNKIQESKDIPSGVKESRAKIVDKFEQIVGQLKGSAEGGLGTEEGALLRPQGTTLRLADIRNNRGGGQPGRKEPDFVVAEDPEDDATIAEWRLQEAKMDQKLDDVNLLLGEIKIMSDNLTREPTGSPSDLRVSGGKA